jgi:hypothetical protein
LSFLPNSRRLSLFGGWTQAALPDGRTIWRQGAPRPPMHGLLGKDAMGPAGFGSQTPSMLPSRDLDTTTRMSDVEEGARSVAGEQTARVSQAVVDLYFAIRPDKKQNLYSNLRTVLGGRFDDKQIRSILDDVLAQPETRMKDLQAFDAWSPGRGPKIQFTPKQKSIVDRFVVGLPKSPLNDVDVKEYSDAVKSGRIVVK